MNLSTPKGESFNDAVAEELVQKLEMSSTRLFRHRIVEAGVRAIMAKFDIHDAYKLVPRHPDHWRLFRFKWLGKFFFDTTTVFGSKISTCFV
jgi:hypothetical protein